MLELQQRLLTQTCPSPFAPTAVCEGYGSPSNPNPSPNANTNANNKRRLRIKSEHEDVW